MSRPTTALVTISGYPSSGKTKRAESLAALFRARLAVSSSAKTVKVVVLNDESLHISKSAYDDTKSEKPARATLFSAVQRNLTPGTIVIVDAMNYIKGARYQMYCAAREVFATTCTIYVAATAEKCVEWNEQRREAEKYARPTLDNLISRFEEPSSSARWDSPLFTLAYFDEPLWDDQSRVASSMGDASWKSVGTEGRSKVPHHCTVPQPTSTTSYLTLLESTTSAVVDALLDVQSLSPLSGPTRLTLSPPAFPSSTPTSITIRISKPVSVAQLHRLRKQFTKLNMQTGKELEADRLASLFADYLESAL